MVIVKNLLGACSLALVCVSLQSRALPVYKIGDIPDQDIVAAVPFEVVDSQAPAALKISKAQDIAAIYHQFTGQTNVMTGTFFAAFARSHLSFSNAVAAAYHKPSIDNSTIEASDFGYLVTAYNVEHKAFPVTTELAVTWARGGSGSALRDKWLGFLLQAIHDPIQPDSVPAHFIFRKRVRVMPVTNVNENFTFAQAWRRGRVISLDKIPGISAARAKLRQQFSEEQQPLAAALAQFLQPDCFPDVELTKMARDYSVQQIVVLDHFDAGQVIVHKDDRINEQEQADFVAMKQATPGMPIQQIPAEQSHAQQEHQLTQVEQPRTQMAPQAGLQQPQAQSDHSLAQNQADQERKPSDAMRYDALLAQQQAQSAMTRNELLIAALAVVSVLALFIFGRSFRQRSTGTEVVKLRPVERLKVSTAADLAPYLAQTLKEAVVQGLAAQRAELLEAQRLAAAEIAELVQRLDKLQTPMQERIRAYQERIQELQKDLTQRNEENRELLKMKIEMMRQQIETERGRVRFN
jgi:hypothetical protein